MIPRRLQRNSRVALISPSYPGAALYPHRVDRAVNRLKQQYGLRVQIGNYAYRRNYYTAGSINERLEDLHVTFCDPKIDGIITMIGGNHCNQLIPHIDYELIRDNPKVFLGYSDITVLHLAIWSKVGLTTFYGPAVLPEFGEYPKPFDYTERHFSRVIFSGDLRHIEPSMQWTDEFLDWSTKEDLTRRRITKPNMGYIPIRLGEATGILLGGCLESLSHILASEYCPDWSGALLFLEVSETTGGLSLADSLLHDLRNAGVFEKVNGVLFGRPYQYSSSETEELWNVVRLVTEPYKLPVLGNLDIGHTDPMTTLPIGTRARMRIEDASYTLELLDPYVL